MNGNVILLVLIGFHVKKPVETSGNKHKINNHDEPS